MTSCSIKCLCFQPMKTQTITKENEVIFICEIVSLKIFQVLAGGEISRGWKVARCNGGIPCFHFDQFFRQFLPNETEHFQVKSLILK